MHLSDRKARPHNDTFVKDIHVSFADGFPLLLISNASLADLNKHCPIKVDMNRFRTNIIAEECIKPYEEDVILKFFIFFNLFYIKFI